MKFDAIYVAMTLFPRTMTPAYKRIRSRFDESRTAVADLLERELLHLRAKDVVIQLDCKPSEIRQDGQLRAGTKPSSPAVVVQFTSVNKLMSFACDQYDSWLANIKAIAKTLEALRAVDRYGATQGGEQYTGFQALPAPDPLAGMVQELCQMSGHSPVTADYLRVSSERVKQFRREVLLALHPDRTKDEPTFKVATNLLDKLLNSFGFQV